MARINAEVFMIMLIFYVLTLEYQTIANDPLEIREASWILAIVE